MEKETKKEEIIKREPSIADKIKNRNSIIKSIVILVFTGLIGYKLIVSNLTFDFSKFDFSDLLALILALFSIGLSVVFYFKATDTSNLFYDNTYKFTKDISEILGRIEAGFGERLKHLDEGYSGLRDKVNGTGIPRKSDEIEDAKKDLDDEKKKLEVQIKEKEEILHELMNKAKLNAKERDIFTNKIKEKDEEINALGNELRLFRKNLSERELSRDNELIHSIPPSVRELLMEFLRLDTDPRMVSDAPIEYLADRLRFSPDRFPKSELLRLMKFRILKDDFSFTTAGIELLKSLTKRIL
jgi:hypothetical protein